MQGNNQGRSAATDSNNKIYIGAVYQGTSNFGGGDVNATHPYGKKDGIVVKYDAFGKIMHLGKFNDQKEIFYGVKFFLLWEETTMLLELLLKEM